MSVIWKLDPDYQVKDVWYGRTVIRSRYKLSYEVAQQLYDGAAASEVRKDISELMDSDLKQEELQKRYIETPLKECVHYILDGSLHAPSAQCISQVLVGSEGTYNGAVPNYNVAVPNCDVYCPALRSGHLTNLDIPLIRTLTPHVTSLIRTPHLSGHLTNLDTSLIWTPH